MKTLRHIQFCLFALLAGAAFTACNEEDPIDPNADIPGLGGEETVQTETDRWLYENYVVPFNIDVEYKWDATDMMPSIDKQLVPVDEELVIPFMQVMYDVWFSPYEQTAGLDFVKEITPKKVVLVGSPEYEFGAIKLGQAEGGRKILLLNVNGFDPSDAANVKEFLHTIEHEFAHILHQTVLFDKNYEKISAGNYLPSGWTSVSDSEARQLGFITPYAMSGKDEDFVEMISVIMVYGREWYDDMVQKTCFQNGKLVNETAYDAFTRKEAIVVDYMKNVWGIEFYDTAGEKGLVTCVQEAIAQVVADNQ